MLHLKKIQLNAREEELKQQTREPRRDGVPVFPLEYAGSA
jgi:hypothetical protein